MTEGSLAGNDALQEIGEQTTRDVGDNRLDLAQALDRIQRDGDLSEQAKSRLAEEARRKASERHAEIVDRHEAASKDVLANNEKRLFKIAYPTSVSTPSEMKAFKGDYRDCTFKVLDMPEDTLSRVMSRASRVGDSALEQACYHEAIERGLFGVADEYRERHPDAKTTWVIYQKSRLSEEAHGATLTHALLASASPSEAER
jgi:hypothetical protein